MTGVESAMEAVGAAVALGYGIGLAFVVFIVLIGKDRG